MPSQLQQVLVDFLLERFAQTQGNRRAGGWRSPEPQGKLRADDHRGRANFSWLLASVTHALIESQEESPDRGKSTLADTTV